VRRSAPIRTLFPAASPAMTALSPNTWATGCWPISAIRGRMEDDAERAVRAGLEIAAAVTSLKTRGTERLAVRIGIATGLVVVGDLVGEGSAQEQSVVGETPNLAARPAPASEDFGSFGADWHAPGVLVRWRH
jgi:class 3 adenylate cyclase